VVLLVAAGLAGCGSFEDYRFQYAAVDAADVAAGAPWAGPERVTVALDPAAVEVPLAGLVAATFRDAPAVPLQTLVAAAALTDEPQRYRYDLTASDGYDLLVKRGAVELLPSWDDLAHGYLYRADDGDLRVGWEADAQPWGGAVSAYRVKYMDGGRVTLLPGP
jgi:hypothetical protein